jgi:hypothetical protein
MNLNKIIQLLCIWIILLKINLTEKIVAQTTADIGINIEKNGELIVLEKDILADFISFTGKEISGVIYLQWTVEKLRTDGTFLIYSSVNGSDYQGIGTKSAVGTSLDTALSYYCKKTANECTNYFKIVYIGADSKYLISEKLAVEPQGSALISENK